MELRQLRALQAVGETGSFSAAADRLDYTQPAVSKIVATLERQLGITLVDRGIRPLRLTEAGSTLTRRATAAFEQLAAAELEVEAIANLTGGSVRVGTFSSAGATMVVDALRTLRTHHPDVAVAITEIGMPSALVRSLRRGDLDLGGTSTTRRSGTRSPTTSPSSISSTIPSTSSCLAATDSNATGRSASPT